MLSNPTCHFGIDGLADAILSASTTATLLGGKFMVSDDDAGIKERPGWLLPVAVFVVTAILSGLVLLYYFAPPANLLVGDRSSPTSRTDRVSLSIGGVS